MSRKGQLWRGELAEQIDAHLAGNLTAADLVDWAIDHPFFEDQTDLDESDQRIIAYALGHILELDESEPDGARTTQEELAEAVEVLWQRRPLPPSAPGRPG
jgi:hypothetical protein